MPGLPYSVDPELLELMPHVITFEKCVGVDEFGQRQYDVPVRVRARVEGRMRKIVGTDGMERMSSIQVYLATSPGLTTNDRITLPPGFQPQQPNIMSIERQADQNGSYYEAISS